MRLFDFDGTRRYFEVDEKDIKYIIVAIVSDSEVVKIYYKCGNIETIETCKESTILSLFDDFYLVEKKDLRKFIQAETNTVDAWTRKEEFERLCAKTS